MDAKPNAGAANKEVDAKGGGNVTGSAKTQLRALLVDGKEDAAIQYMVDILGGDSDLLYEMIIDAALTVKELNRLNTLVNGRLDYPSLWEFTSDYKTSNDKPNHDLANQIQAAKQNPTTASPATSTDT